MPDQTLFLFADGVSEALNGRREFFGIARLKEALQTAASASAQTVAACEVEQVRDLSGDRKQSDDIPALALRWLAPVNAEATAVNKRAHTDTATSPD